jgi:hypothetical protein
VNFTVNLGPSAVAVFCEQVQVGIVEDNTLELNETLQIELSSTDLGLLSPASMAVISITNDDCK